MTDGAPADSRPLLVFAHAGRDWIRGSERCLLDLLANLDQTRFRRLVLCNAPTLAREAAATGAEVVRIERWPRSAVGALSRRGWALELLRRRDAALVHANWPSVLPVLQPAAHRLGVPVLSHLHLPYRSFREYQRHLIRQGAAVVGVAENVVAPLRASSLPPDRIHVVPNAVDDARLAAGDARGLRATLGIARAALVAASVGSLIHRKGHDVTVRAVARAHARGLDLHLLLCGGGDDARSLGALASRLGVGDRVHLLGERADAGAILRDAADVLVSSARAEALPLNVIEAQWVGVPIVASDIPGHREALAPDAGLLVPLEAPDALAAALLDLAAAPERRAAMAAAGRDFARARFRMESYVAAFEALYARLLHERRDAGPAAERGWPPTVGVWARSELARRARKLRGRWSGAGDGESPEA